MLFRSHVIDPDEKEGWLEAIVPALAEVNMELSAHATTPPQMPPAGQFLVWAVFYIQALQVGHLCFLSQLTTRNNLGPGYELNKLVAAVFDVLSHH